MIAFPLAPDHAERVRRLLGGPGSGNFGHAGRPGKVGGSADRLTASEMRARPLPTSLADAENLIRNQPHEHGFLVRNGTPVQYFGNDHREYIDIGAIPDRDDPFDDAVFTHNHPSTLSLSPDDVLTAARRNLAEVRAVTDAGVFTMKRGETTWPTIEEMTRAIDRAKHDAQSLLLGMLAGDLITREQANAKLWPLVWSAVLKEINATAPDDPPITYGFEARQ